MAIKTKQLKGTFPDPWSVGSFVPHQRKGIKTRPAVKGDDDGRPFRPQKQLTFSFSSSF